MLRRCSGQGAGVVSEVRRQFGSEQRGERLVFVVGGWDGASGGLVEG